MSHLQYFFTFSDNQEKLGFHLDPENSDFEPNLVVLSSLVGTLVRTGASGKAEPYIAERYTIGNDRKEWTYTFRKHLYCEDGTAITPKAYATRLSFMLRKYAETSSPIDFENLVGWQDFFSGKSAEISGIRTTENEISFKFDRAPEALNEFLRMPYFGFWCEANFATDGSWKKDHKFVSSGAYKIADGHSMQSAKLTTRDNWFSISETSAKVVTFAFASTAEVLNWRRENSGESFFIHSVDGVNWTSLHDVRKIQGIPDSLSAVVINPRKASGLDSQAARQILQEAIRSEARAAGQLKSEFFYVTGKSDIIRNDTSSSSKDVLRGMTLTLPVRGTQLNERAQMLVDILKQALQRIGAKLEVIYLDPTDPLTNERMMNPDLFDLRMSAVGIGGHFLNSAVKMIFCTKMGVSYPDPSGRICKLVQKQENLDSPIDQNYIREFNQVLEEDASVIPFMHRGSVWFMSNDLYAETMSQVAEFPNLEDLRR